MSLPFNTSRDSHVNTFPSTGLTKIVPLVLFYLHNQIWEEIKFKHNVSQVIHFPILALHPSGRPYAKHTPQLPSIDTTSDGALQTHPSSCNVLVYTHKIGNTPSNTPTTNAITTQPSISQIHQTILYLLFNPLLSLLTLSHQLLPPSLFFHLLLNILRQIFK